MECDAGGVMDDDSAPIEHSSDQSVEGRETRQYKCRYSSPEMWLYWRNLLPVQSGSADCCWRRIVFTHSLSYAIVLVYSMVDRCNFIAILNRSLRGVAVCLPAGLPPALPPR